MAKVRVHDLAREFGTSAEAVLRLLNGRGFTTKSASSKVDAFAVEWLRFEFTVDYPAPGVPPALPETRRHIRARPSSSSARRSPFERPVQDYEWGFSSSWRGRAEAVVAVPHRPRRLPTRTTLAFGSSPSEAASLEVSSIEHGLAGSPYSISPAQRSYLTATFLPRAAALSIRAQREQERIAATRRRTLARILRSSEVYESNKIEGLGPDMSTTDEILRTRNLHRKVDISVAHGAIQQCLTAEPKVRDVIGLGAARLLAEIFAPARRLYARHGFEPCPPFGDYRPDPFSVFLTREV